jgi:Fe-Mn family superoxide dismutase
MPSDALRNAMISTWNDMDSFKTEFKKAAMAIFGSGWAWVIKDAEGKLSITTTPNQDNPLMDVADKRGIPVLGVDVWEHAYYLKNQNRRADYLDSFMQVIDWSFASKQFGQ